MSGGPKDRSSAPAAKLPAVILIHLDDGKAVLVGSKHLEAKDKLLFPHKATTEVFVTQSGHDHSPHIGFNVSIDHGDLDSPHTGAHFEVQTEIKPTQSYTLSFVASVKKANLEVRKLPGYSPDRDELDTIMSRLIHPSIVDANKNGTDAALVALVVTLDQTKFELVTYPPTVAEGPNYDIVHNDEPFDDGATVSKILSSSSIVAFVPRIYCKLVTNSFSCGKADNVVEGHYPWGIQPMLRYNRQHLERVEDALFLSPVPVQRVTDWDHYRTAIVLGMGADTFRMQKDIEKLAITPCRAILSRAEDGTLIAGFERPKDNSLSKLFAAVNRGGRKFMICRSQPVESDPNSTAKKPKLEERDPFPAMIIDIVPAGVNLPRSFHLVAQLNPRRVIPAELSDLVPSDGQTEVVLWLQFPDNTKQTIPCFGGY